MNLLMTKISPAKRVKLEVINLRPLLWSVTRFIGDCGESLFEGSHLQVAEWLRTRHYRPVIGLNGIWEQPQGTIETPRLNYAAEA